MEIPVRISDRWLFCGETVAALGLLAGALILGEIFRLHPCYWCSFQRFLCMVLAFLGCCGMLLPGWRSVWALLSGLTALGGVFAAGKQSWMQLAEDAVECGFGDPTLNERLVDWLSELWPSMFMATGLCKSKDWVFLGLTLANWSGVCFLMLFGASIWMLFRRRDQESGIRDQGSGVRSQESGVREQVEPVVAKPQATCLIPDP